MHVCIYVNIYVNIHVNMGIWEFVRCLELWLHLCSIVVMFLYY